MRADVVLRHIGRGEACECRADGQRRRCVHCEVAAGVVFIRLDAPHTSLPKALRLCVAVVVVEAVCSVHGKRLEAQTHMRRLDKVAVTVGEEGQWERS